MINWNTEPYNDDFDENSKFHRILFRPSYAVQARELTQLQSILQDQIKKNGDHLFKQGAMVIPGQISMDTEYHYVKIQPTYGALNVSSYVDQFEGVVVTGSISGVTALVLKAEQAVGTDPITLYVRYTNSGTDGATRVFTESEELTTASSGTVVTFATAATGIGSAVAIERGVYYVNGYYVLCDAQTLLLDKYTNQPTYRIGLTIDEQKVTPEDDETLLDNAQTSFNYAAPGAHRYFIDLILSKISVETTSDDNFIELIRTISGIVDKKIDTTLYSEIEKTMARRTYDESGNYTVSNFAIDVREHRNNNRGQWTLATPYLIGDIVTNLGHTYVAKISAASGLTAPTHTSGSVYDGAGSTGVNWTYNETPKYNRGIYLDGSESKLAIGLEPGKAYIQGYEVEKIAKEYVAIDKARDFVQVDNAVIPATVGNYVLVTNLNNIPKFDTFETVELYDRITNSGGRGTPVGTKIGTCRVRGVEWDNGTIGSNTATYKLFLFDITMNAGKDFNKNVKSFYHSGGSAPLSFTADISPVATYINGTYISSFNMSIPTSSINTTTDTIAYASHGLISGTSVSYDHGGGTAASGLTSGNTYYVATAGLTANAFELKSINTTSTLAATVAITGTSTATFTCGNSTLSTGFRVTITGTNTGSGVIGSYVSGTTYKVSSVTGSSPNVTGFTLQTESGGAISGNTPGSLIGLTYTVETVIDISGTGNNAQTLVPILTTITGQGTSFQTDLLTGEYIYLGSELRRVVTISGQQTLTVDVAPTLTGQVIKLARTELKDPQNSGLIFPFPYYAIKSARSVNNTNDTTYTVTERFTGKVSSGGILSITTSTGVFASYADSDNYLFTDQATGNIVKETNITGTNTSTIVVDIASGTYTVQAVINRSGGSLTEKTKITNTATVLLTDIAAVTNKVLILGKADLIKIISIKMMSGNFASPPSPYSIDISDRYTVDNGNRDSYYDIARLNLIPSFNAPEAPVEIIFEYFDHGTGDYFTVNSYPSDIKYEEIDALLRDSIDFRPRISDAGVLFSGAGSSTSLMPKRGIDVRSDFTYYLPRTDKIVLSDNGIFSGIAGISSLDPKSSGTPVGSMLLYELSIESYTFSTTSDSIQISSTDNKRYTMRDIGKLEKRIDNLEYYTSLSLLEQHTESMDITDESGLSRFKNGFIVDAFTGHGVGDTTSLDYLCSVDDKNSELRPFFTMDNVNLIEKNTGELGRTAANYKLYGDVITLPVIDHVKLVEQRYASRVENLNPFAIFTFLGDVKINPSSDEWFEVNRRPDIIQNVEGDFNFMHTLAEKAGVLGTVWNAWEISWTGSTVSTGQQNHTSTYGYKHKGHKRTAYRNWTVESYATKVGYTRNGIFTNVVAKFDKVLLEDKVLSTAVIPYIRSRNILIQVFGLKPSTKFYPFFDGVDISPYCTPSTKLIYTLQSGVFNVESDVGGESTEASRTINGDSQVCLNKGDVVFVSSRGLNSYTKINSPVTAVVIGKEYNIDTGIRTLHLANIKGEFLFNDIIQGTVSAAVGHVDSAPTVVSTGGELRTNFAGELSMIFNIPNTSAASFRTGNKEFKLLDVSNVDGIWTSRARTQYNAVGILETKQKTIQSIRNSQLVSERVDQAEERVQVTTAVIRDTGWYDPLAQTFLVNAVGGAFVSKIDIFFATKDTTIPVSLEIREVVNGTPGKRVLPFSKVTLNPDQVNISNTVVSIVDRTTKSTTEMPKYDTPTTFTFPSPVYVEDQAEYSIVLVSNSNNYRVWISNMGDAIPDSSQTISEQPYAGVLFKSQNASTWTPNQDQDLKFTIWRAKFDTTVVGNVEFVNDVLPYDTLDANPIEVNVDTNTVRVWHANHGMPVGSTTQLTNLTTEDIVGTAGVGTITCDITGTAVAGVDTVFNTSIGTTTVGAGTVLYNSGGVLIGVVASVTDDLNLVLVANAAVAVTGGAYSIAAPIAGIPVTEIYKSQVIGNVDLDSYTITTTTNANTTGYFGGDTVRATKNAQYDSFYPIVQNQVFVDTTTDYEIKMTSGKSVDGSQTPYTVGSFKGCLVNETTTLNAPSIVASQINETLLVGGNKSLSFSAKISSTNDALSPIIDTHRLSLIAISNKVNSPAEANMNVAELDTATLFTGVTGAFSFSGSTITSTNTDVRDLIKTIQVGKYITVSASTTAGNDGTYLVTGNVDDDTNGTITVSDKTFVGEAGAAGTTVAVRKMFVDEIAPVGSSTHSKYVSKIINLENPSTYIRVRLAANVPDEAELLVYYKIIGVGSIHEPETINWILFNSDEVGVKVQNGDPSFTDVDYSIIGLVPFDAVQIKLVMKSTNSSAVPRVKDLRIICCA